LRDYNPVVSPRLCGIDLERLQRHNVVASLSRAKEMKKLHGQIRAHIEKVNEAYKAKANKNRKGVEYQPRDPVWLCLRKERFPTRRKSKLMSREDGSFNVLAKVGANTYKLELHADTTVSATFNVDDLNPYVKDDIDFGDLRETPFKGGRMMQIRPLFKSLNLSKGRICSLTSSKSHFVRANNAFLRLV